jgi:hypothetical protein
MVAKEPSEQRIRSGEPDRTNRAAPHTPMEPASMPTLAHIHVDDPASATALARCVRRFPLQS